MAVTFSLPMTNEVVILLKYDCPFQAAHQAYLFYHLCSELSPVVCNSSLSTWPEKSPAGGGVYPLNVKGNILVSQAGHMWEVVP